MLEKYNSDLLNAEQWIHFKSLIAKFVVYFKIVSKCIKLSFEKTYLLPLKVNKNKQEFRSFKVVALKLHLLLDLNKTIKMQSKITFDKLSYLCVTHFMKYCNLVICNILKLLKN